MNKLYIVPRNRHGLKYIRRFQEDIFNIFANKILVSKKPSKKFSKKYIIKKKILKNGRKILSLLYQIYQNNYKYKRLLLKSRRKFFRKKFFKRKPRFRYIISVREKEFRRKRWNFRTIHYLNLLKLRRFYGNLSKRKIKHLFKESSLNSNFLGKSFIFLLETRLDVLLYRSNFFDSIFKARQYILHQGIHVNGLCLKKPSYKINLGTYVYMYNFMYNNIRKSIYLRFKKKKVLPNYPAYLEVNYKLGIFNLFKIPVFNQVPFPFFVSYKHIGYNYL